MKIKNFTFCLYLIIIISARPVVAQQISNGQASLFPITVQQVNGSSLTIMGKSSLLNSWTETVNGYTIVNKNGNYKYANKINGELMPTGAVARNAKDRKPAENVSLRKVTKSIRPEVPVRSNSPALYKSKSEATGSPQLGLPATRQRKALLILI